MSKPGRATQAKRNRERAKQEQQQEKKDRRAIRKEEKAQSLSNARPGEDPDLIGIVPGPQKPIED